MSERNFFACVLAVKRESTNGAAIVGLRIRRKDNFQPVRRTHHSPGQAVLRAPLG
jgi:hypothetical protein